MPTTTYCTLEALTERFGMPDVIDSNELLDAIESASREIDAYCGRYFYQDDAATTRSFYATGTEHLWVDDISTPTGVVVKADDNDDGTFETTWASTDFQLEPLNGIVDGVTGWPYTRIRAVGDYRFLTALRRPRVQVTARWGWPAVPAPVRQACMELAAEAFKMKDAPFGVAGFGEFGAVRVLDMLPQTRRRLALYVR